MTDIPSYLDWKAGDKVVCINAKNNPGCRWFPGESPTEGNIYTIDRIFVDGEGFLVLALVELPREDWEYGPAGYTVNRFRPVQTKKTCIGIFNRILLNPRIRISEDA